jgi:hypothetical protein
MVATTSEASDHKPTKKRKIKKVQAPAVNAEEKEDEEEEVPLSGRAWIFQTSQKIPKESNAPDSVLVKEASQLLDASPKNKISEGTSEAANLSSKVVKV